LYGLRQASRQWNQKLTAAISSIGYQQSYSDPSLFVKSSSSKMTAILIYVDHIVLTGNDMPEISRVKAFLDSKFSIKDIGPLKYFLGLEIARSKSGLLLNQRKYCLELIDEYVLLGCKPSPTPIDPSTKLSSTQRELLSDPSKFRRIVGRLLYLTNTRPDISFAVQQLSQFMSQPCLPHFEAALRILRYLKNSPGLGLLYPTTNNFKVQAFSDSDWAACPNTRGL
jgi:hypothetical protein